MADSFSSAELSADSLGADQVMALLNFSTNRAVRLAGASGVFPYRYVGRVDDYLHSDNLSWGYMGSKFQNWNYIRSKLVACQEGVREWIYQRK